MVVLMEVIITIIPLRRRVPKKIQMSLFELCYRILTVPFYLIIEREAI